MLKKLRFKSEDNRNVRVWTIGQGEPVVVLHGLGITGLPLFPIFSLFLHKYMFILPEARGHGRTDFGEVNLSSKSLESYLADDLEEILNHLKVKPKYMIAYSMGAMTALEFLSREKNSFIKKYLHIDFPVVFYDKNNNNSFFRNSISNDLHNSHKDLIADLKKDKYHKKVKLDNDEISYVTELYFKHYKELLNVSLANNVLSMTLNMVPEILIKKTMPDINIVHYILMSLYFNGGNFVDRARKIKAHTFLVACTKESLFDCHTVLAFSKLIKRTEKIVIKNGSHSCLFTNPIQIQKVLRRFLE